MSRVVLRSGHKDDYGLIFKTWTRVAWERAAVRPPMKRKEWFALHYGYVCDVLEEGDIFVACLEDDPHTILGYSVVSEGHLQWVFVKSDFQRMGIGTLLAGFWPVSELHMTKTGRAILNKRKERDNERSEHSSSDPLQPSTGITPSSSREARDSSDSSEVSPSSH